MSIRQDILAKPNDIAALQKKGYSKPDLVDNLFINFLYYAKHHWSYIASSSFGGEHRRSSSRSVCEATTGPAGETAPYRVNSHGGRWVVVDETGRIVVVCRDETGATDYAVLLNDAYWRGHKAGYRGAKQPD